MGSEGGREPDGTGGKEGGMTVTYTYSNRYSNFFYIKNVLFMNSNMLPTVHILKSVLNLQMTYIIIAHIYEQWDR